MVLSNEAFVGLLGRMMIAKDDFLVLVGERMPCGTCFCPKVLPLVDAEGRTWSCRWGTTCVAAMTSGDTCNISVHDRVSRGINVEGIIIIVFVVSELIIG
jgi:hypothetical protein